MNLDNVLRLASQSYRVGDLQQAETICKRIIKKHPKNFKAVYLLGKISLKLKNYDIAIKYFSRALQLDHNNSDIYLNLGFVYTQKGHPDEAINYYKKALQLNPDLYDAYNNIGMALMEKRKPNEALNYYQKALQMNPNLADAHGNISLTLLLLGNFEDGWKEYEWRWKLKDYFVRDFLQPLWDGSEISGKTILLHAEQGLGDAIQFIRYISFVTQHNARVIVECQKELVSLFQTLGGIEQVIARGNPLPHFDLHCPLLSLPLISGTTLDTIPSDIPYIKVDPDFVQKWKIKLNDDNSKFKVGLVWAGSPSNKNDRNRSFSLDTFTPLAQFDNIIFYSLQKGKGSEQAKSPPDGMEFIDYTDGIHDFSDTAAFIENLDLVISVDTAVAHLAGALGKPVWTLIPFAPDWRWMLNREDSPWYPTMRLFRQPSWGDWETVINRMKEELRDLIQTH